MKARLAVVLAILLGGCGNNPGVIDDMKLLRQRLTKSSAPAAAGPPVISRAVLDAIGKPLLYAGAPKREVASVFALIQTRGPLVTWGSSDGATLTFRDGILVASRGLGDDLTSASVPALADIAGGVGSAERVHYGYRRGDSEVPTRFRCDLALVGTEALKVSELVFRVRHVTESCQGDAEAFRNEYWIETGGKIRQSRQWIGETVGYLDLRLLSR